MNKIRKESSQNHRNEGILYIVSTPIGNLEDITLRALKILKSVDLIAAENVRHSKRLARHYDIDTRMTVYHQHNHKRKTPELIDKLKSGFCIALISSAGTPAISDPGAELIRLAINESVKVTPIPGPSAVITALSASGLRSDRFLFLGFLSNKKGKRKKELKDLVDVPRTMVFYEAPHRIIAMMKDILEILGDRSVAVFRELTKVYEEVYRGQISHVLLNFDEKKIRGEFTLVVSGKEEGSKKKLLDKNTKKRIKKLLLDGNMSLKEVAIQLSNDEAFPYRTVYRECLAMKKGLEQEK